MASGAHLHFEPQVNAVLGRRPQGVWGFPNNIVNGHVGVATAEGDLLYRVGRESEEAPLTEREVRKRPRLQGHL